MGTKKSDDAAGGTEMTLEEAVKLFTRQVPKTDKDGKPVADDDGNQVMTDVPLDPKEVFAFKDHGDHVVVVTVDGQKFKAGK